MHRWRFDHFEPDKVMRVRTKPYRLQGVAPEILEVSNESNWKGKKSFYLSAYFIWILIYLSIFIEVLWGPHAFGARPVKRFVFYHYLFVLFSFLSLHSPRHQFVASQTKGRNYISTLWKFHLQTVSLLGNFCAILIENRSDSLPDFMNKISKILAENYTIFLSRKI